MPDLPGFVAAAAGGGAAAGPATVKAAPVGPTDTLAKYLTTPIGAAVGGVAGGAGGAGALGLQVFTDYIVDSTFEGDLRRYMLGITSPGGFQSQSVAFCQLAAQTLLWVCEWTACRTGAQPQIPDPDSKDPDWVLLDVIPATRNVVNASDGVTPVYRISGTYVYGRSSPKSNVIDDVNYARPPWLPDDFDRSQPAATLAGNIITGRGAGGGGANNVVAPKNVGN